MSDRSLWPDGVEIHQVDLQRETSARIVGTLKRQTDSSYQGIVTGLVVSVNGSDATKLDVSAGNGYSPNGELVTVGTTQTSLALADYTLNTVNVVILFNYEIQSLPEPHEDLALTLNTAATNSFRLKTLTLAQYNALPATTALISADSADKALVLALVTANGAAIALTGNSITNSAAYGSIFATAQPKLITGVLVTAISSTTPTGTGSLKLNVGSPNSLQWAAPGGSLGTAVNITVDGSYTLFTSGGASSITVSVTLSSLPGATVTETLTITNLYLQTVPRFSARDDQHRHLLGSGAPSATNPHGMTLSDVVGGSGSLDIVLQEHQDIFHSNGVLKAATPERLNRTVLSMTVQHVGGQPDEIIVAPFGALDRCYINGLKVSAISGSNHVTFVDSGISLGYLELFGVYMSELGVLTHSVRRVKMNPDGTGVGGGSPDPFSGTVQVVAVSDNFTAATTDQSIYYEFATDSLYLLDTTPGPAQPSTQNFKPIKTARPATDSIVRLFLHDRLHWVDVWVRGSLWGVGSDQKVLIRIYSELDLDVFMRLGYIVSHGLATNILGYGPYGIASGATTNLIPTRLWGTLNDAEMRDDAVDRLRDRHARERHADGVIGLGFSLGTLTAGTLSLGGGVLYLNGQRFEVPSTAVAGLVNGRNYVYCTFDNTLQQVTLVATTSFTTAYNAANSGVGSLILWSIDVTAGAITFSSRICRDVSKIDNHVALTVDPSGQNGMFTTVSAAIDYIKQLRAISVPAPGKIVCRAGTYQEPLEIYPISDLIIEGEGFLTKFLPPTGATGGVKIVFNCATPGGSVSDITFRGIGFDSDLIGWTGHFLKLVQSSRIEDCVFTNSLIALNGSGIQIGDGTNTARDIVITNCLFDGLQVGVNANTAPSGSQIHEFEVTNCQFKVGNPSLSGIALTNASSGLISGCVFRITTANLSGGSPALVTGFAGVSGGVINGLSITNCEIEDIGPNTTSPPAHGLFIASSGAISNVDIIGNIIKECKSAVSMTGSGSPVRNVNISNNVITRGTQAALHAGAAITVTPSSGIDQLMISGNRIENPPTAGISVANAIGAVAINGNHIEATDTFCAHGINYEKGGDTAGNEASVIVSNNTVIGPVFAASIQHDAANRSVGIAVCLGANGGSINVTNNKIKNVNATGSGVDAVGILTAGGSANVVVDNNQITTIGRSVSTGAAGIKMLGPARAVVTHNRISTVTCTGGTARYGVYFDSYTSLDFSSNVIVGVDGTGYGLYVDIQPNNVTVVNANIFETIGKSAIFFNDLMANVTLTANAINGTGAGVTGDAIHFSNILTGGSISDNYIISSTTGAAIFIAGAQFVSVSGNSIITTGSSAAGIKFSAPAANCTIDDNSIGNTAGEGILFSNTTTGVVLTNNNFNTIGTIGVSCVGNVTDVTVSNNSFSTIASNAFRSPAQVLDFRFTNNTIAGAGTTGLAIVDLFGTLNAGAVNKTASSSISNNTVDNFGVGAIQAFIRVGNKADTLSISDNKVTNLTASQIILFNNNLSGTGYAVENIEINNNYFRDNTISVDCISINLSVTPNNVCIKGNNIWNVHGCNSIVKFNTCSNGLISDNMISTSPGYGVWFVGAVTNTEIHNNTIVGGASSQAGIVVDGTASMAGSVISGNSISSMGQGWALNSGDVGAIYIIGPVSKTIISGNILTTLSNGGGGTTKTHGVYINAIVTGVAINNNIVDAPPSLASGIYVILVATSKSLSIQQNTINGWVNTGDAGVYPHGGAIVLVGQANSVNISNNNLFDGGEFSGGIQWDNNAASGTHCFDTVINNNTIHLLGVSAKRFIDLGSTTFPAATGWQTLTICGNNGKRDTVAVGQTSYLFITYVKQLSLTGNALRADTNHIAIAIRIGSLGGGAAFGNSVSADSLVTAGGTLSIGVAIGGGFNNGTVGLDQNASAFFTYNDVNNLY